MDQTLNNTLPEYTGTVQPEEPGLRNEQGQVQYPYLPDEALIEAVNLALYLQRPLLLRGEPGCGKTRLASAVAFELSLPYKPWHIKSTSRARDGLYLYDAVGRLRDAQLAATGNLTAIEIERMRDPEGYITWGALGQAFREERKTVVLIDEIDKADLNFPNDLLWNSTSSDLLSKRRDNLYKPGNLPWSLSPVTMRKNYLMLFCGVVCSIM